MKELKDLLNGSRSKSKTPLKNAPRLSHESAQSETADDMNCQTCGGVQYLREDLPVGHPAFGKYTPCPDCNAEALLLGTRLSERERAINLYDLDTNGREGTTAMIQAAEMFLNNNCAGLLSFHGGYGNGKSTALKAIVNACAQSGIEAQYITLTEIMLIVREAFNVQGESDYGRIKRLASVRVLAIDECEKARVTDYAAEIQSYFFDARYRNIDTLGTVLAWNGAFEKFELPWVRSRLTEGIIVENNDSDMRDVIGQINQSQHGGK